MRDYTIPVEGLVMLDLYNTLGEKVQTLVYQNQAQGSYRLQLDASNLPEGTYFLRLAEGGKVVSRRVILSR